MWVTASRLGEDGVNPQYIQFMKDVVINYPSTLRNLALLSVAENLIHNGYFQFIVSSLEGIPDDSLKVHLKDRKSFY